MSVIKLQKLNFCCTLTTTGVFSIFETKNIFKNNSKFIRIFKAFLMKMFSLDGSINDEAQRRVQFSIHHNYVGLSCDNAEYLLPQNF